MSNYILDIVIFNRIVEDRLELCDFVNESDKIFATHMQQDEINNILKDNDKRTIEEQKENIKKHEDLSKLFVMIDPDMLPTAVSVWDDSSWGSGWGNDKEHEVYDKILAKLAPKRDQLNPSKDARLAATAISKNYILVTDDGPLHRAICEIGYGKNSYFIRGKLTNVRN